MPANFGSNSLSAVQWSNGGRTCSASSFAVLAALQERILQAIDMNGGQLNGLTSSALDLIDVSGGNATGDGWNARTLTALLNALTKYGAPGRYITAVARDSLLSPGQSLSTDTIRAALWFASTAAYSASPRYADHPDWPDSIVTGSPDSITLTGGAITPTYGSMPPVPSNGVFDDNINCTGSLSGPPAVGGTATVMGTLMANPLLLLGLIGAAAVGMSLMAHSVARRRNPRRKKRR